MNNIKIMNNNKPNSKLKRKSKMRNSNIHNLILPLNVCFNIDGKTAILSTSI